MRNSKKEELKYIKFNAGEIIKKLPVTYEDESELKVIKIDDIPSSVTRNNLLKFQTLYKIKWISVTRYIVPGTFRERYGYIIKGLLPSGNIITYLRKETKSKSSGTTELWFGRGYMIPATKILRANLELYKRIENWGDNIKKGAIYAWYELTGDGRILMSYKLSRVVYGEMNKNQQIHKYPEEVISWVVSIAKKLDNEDFLRLINEIQKVQFERT